MFRGSILASNEILDSTTLEGIYKTSQVNSGNGVNDHGVMFVFKKSEKSTMQILYTIRNQIYMRYHTSSGTEWGEWSEFQKTK